MTKSIGCYGVRIGEVDKLTYASNSDRLILIEEIGTAIKIYGYKQIMVRWKKQAKALTMVTGHDCPLQTISFNRILSSGRAYNATEFICDSFACEWAYIMNLDAEVLELYDGNQRKNHNRGRYSNIQIETKEGFVHMGQPSYRRKQAASHYPCALLTTIPLIDLIDFDPYKHIIPED